MAACLAASILVRPSAVRSLMLPEQSSTIARLLISLAASTSVRTAPIASSSASVAPSRLSSSACSLLRVKVVGDCFRRSRISGSGTPRFSNSTTS